MYVCESHTGQMKGGVMLHSHCGKANQLAWWDVGQPQQQTAVVVLINKMFSYLMYKRSHSKHSLVVTVLKRNSLSALSALEGDTRRTRERTLICVRIQRLSPCPVCKSAMPELSIILQLKTIKIAINIATYSALAQCECTIWHGMSRYNAPWERLSLFLPMWRILSIYLHVTIVFSVNNHITFLILTIQFVLKLPVAYLGWSALRV